MLLDRRPLTLYRARRLRHHVRSAARRLGAARLRPRRLRGRSRTRCPRRRRLAQEGTVTARRHTRASRLTARLATFGAVAAVVAGISASAPQAAGIPPRSRGHDRRSPSTARSVCPGARPRARPPTRSTAARPRPRSHTEVSPTNLTATSFTDTTAVNGQTYFYAVRAVSDRRATPPPSQITQVTPRAASCSTGNAIVRENCFPGTTAWKGPDNVPAYPDAHRGLRVGLQRQRRRQCRRARAHRTGASPTASRSTAPAGTAATRVA